MPRIGLQSRLAAAGAVVTLAGGMTLAMAGPAAAYGPQQVYQVELSTNIPGPNGGGAWLWFGLSSNGTGDYQGSDCGHLNGPAASDGGDVTWKFINNGQNVEIDGVVLNGLGGFVATVTVPAAFGHSTGTLGSFITVPPFIDPSAGFSQLQVAP